MQTIEVKIDGILNVVDVTILILKVNDMIMTIDIILIKIMVAKGFSVITVENLNAKNLNIDLTIVFKLMLLKIRLRIIIKIQRHYCWLATLLMLLTKINSSWTLDIVTIRVEKKPIF